MPTMKTIARMTATLATCALFSTAVQAHIIPWREGEPRMKGFGHCAKGPCIKRYDFRESKPHRHVNGQIVFDRIARGYVLTR